MELILIGVKIAIGYFIAKALLVTAYHFYERR